jgi:hypothetical protein
MKKVVRAAVAVTSALVVGAFATPAAYFVAVSISPPMTDGHRVMPLGQVAIAVISGALLAVITAVLVARRGFR